MKIFLKVPSEVHNKEGKKPLHAKKETFSLMVGPLHVFLGQIYTFMH